MESEQTLNDNYRSIMDSIIKHKPNTIRRPDLSDAIFEKNNDELEKFISQVKNMGGNVASVEAINSFMEENKVISYYPNHDITKKSFKFSHPADLVDLDIAIIPCDFAVSENGAMWVTDRHCPERIIPFITEHLVIIVDRNSIVPTMHEAYRKINLHDTQFGVFISGPSKTADIEQSLVIGAQGPKRLTVIVSDPIHY